MVQLRLDPADEFMHDREDADNFNESMYFNAYDPTQRLGGFFRLGNRPNEGYAEMTVCVYLPDERVAFMFDRPEIDGNDTFDAGGLTFRIERPFEEQHITYQGKVLILDDPLDMADPGQAFRTNPARDASVKIAWCGSSPMFGGELVDDDGRPLQDGAHEQAFARGHYEQHGEAIGSIQIGDASWELDGRGLRDHSWGPRSWQAPWWYRWLTANFDPTDGEHGVGGFMVSIIAARDGSRRIGGMVLRDGKYSLIERAQLVTVWDDNGHQRQLTVRVGAFGADYEITGEVLNLIPLRHRRSTSDGEELMTRIAEGLTRWTIRALDTDGRDGSPPAQVGFGMSEYLDQIVDGSPVGLDS